MVRLSPVAVLGCWLLSACEQAPSGNPSNLGGAGTAGSAAGGSSAMPVSCETRPQASVAPLKILIKGEYERALRGALGDAVVDGARTLLSQLSDQKPLHGFRTMATGTTGGDVEARFQVADQIAQLVAQQPAQLAPFAACAAASLDTACADELLPQLGLRLFRRPLEPAEVEWLRSTYAEGEAIATGDGLRFAVFALLTSPHFEYRLETRGAPSASDPAVLELSGYELASRLSFLVWGSAPDDALLQRAAAGSLGDEAGLKSELERLLGDPRARAQLDRFYRQWLEFEELPIVNQSASFLDGIVGGGLAEAMQRELSETLLGLTFDSRGPFAELYTSNAAYIDFAELTKLYGIAPPSADPHVALPSSERAGLLTRSALLLTSGETTSPIRRGAFVRRKLLCDAIPPPDPSSFPPGAIAPPAFDPAATGRQRWTAKTSQAQCVGCHGQFNDLGFALESYDSIGRYRTEEPIVDPTTGTTLTSLPIDATVDVVLDSDPVHVQSAVELGAAFAASSRAQQCLATQWLRFTAGRAEVDSDACLLEDVQTQLAGGASLLDALSHTLLAPELRVRRLEAP